jgi:hypothetical protein
LALPKVLSGKADITVAFEATMRRLTASAGFSSSDSKGG